MTYNDYFYTNYTKGKFQCFKYINKYYTEFGSGYRSRLSKIDIFGTLYCILCPSIMKNSFFLYNYFPFLISPCIYK